MNAPFSLCEQFGAGLSVGDDRTAQGDELVACVVFDRPRVANVGHY